MARVLIAGCGYVGSALASRMNAGGHDVFGLRRSAISERELAFTPVVADLTEPRSLARALPEGIELVVYAASAGGRTEAHYRAAYVEGLESLLGALREHPVRRFVFLSSTGVYEIDDGAWVDESTPTEPQHFSGRLLLHGETIARRAPFESIVLRLSGIYGPGRTRLVESVRDGSARRTREAIYTNRIHRDDCAGAIEHLLSVESPDALYIGTDSLPAPKNEVLEFLADALGVPHPAYAANGPPANRAARGHKRCDGGRLARSGYRLEFPTFRDGYGRLVAALEGRAGSD